MFYNFPRNILSSIACINSWHSLPWVPVQQLLTFTRRHLVKIQQVKENRAMSRSPAMDTLRDLSSALWTIRSNQEAARVLRTTNSLLRCFLFFDICYLISGIALITMALTNQLENRDKMIMFGGLFGVFASISALCNR